MVEVIQGDSVARIYHVTKHTFSLNIVSCTYRPRCYYHCVYKARERAKRPIYHRNSMFKQTSPRRDVTVDQMYMMLIAFAAQDRTNIYQLSSTNRDCLQTRWQHAVQRLQDLEKQSLEST